MRITRSSRRTALMLGAALFSAHLWAADGAYPNRPITMIVPYPPGGGTDVVSRIIAKAAEPLLGQPVVVQNKSGAGGTVGQQILAQAKPDGYTIGLIVNHPTVVMPHVSPLPYKPTDFAPVTQITEGQIVFCARPDFPARDANELIAYAKQRPDQLTYAGDGVGGSAHVLGERIFQAVGIKLRLIPYKGAGDSVVALLGNQVDLYGGSVPPVLPHIATGKIRCLLLTSTERSPALPGVMAARDLGIPDRGSSVWHGVAAPAGTPRASIVILEKAFRAAALQDDVRKRLEDAGVSVVASDSETFGRAIVVEHASFADVVKKLDLEQK